MAVLEHLPLRIVLRIVSLIHLRMSCSDSLRWLRNGKARQGGELLVLQLLQTP
jgi:hypothetical protein